MRRCNRRRWGDVIVAQHSRDVVLAAVQQPVASGRGAGWAAQHVLRVPRFAHAPRVPVGGTARDGGAEARPLGARLRRTTMPASPRVRARSAFVGDVIGAIAVGDTGLPWAQYGAESSLQPAHIRGCRNAFALKP